MRSAAAGEHRTGEDTAKRTLGRARRRATVAKRDGGLRGLATGVSAREGKNAARRAPSCGRRPHHFRGLDVQKGLVPSGRRQPKGKR